MGKVHYVRVSLSAPKEGSHEKVVRIEEQLLDFLRSQPGFNEAYRLTSPSYAGHVTVWDSHTSADQAATGTRRFRFARSCYRWSPNR